MSETAFIVAKIGRHPSNRMWLTFQSCAPCWTADKSRAARFGDEVSALALVDRDTGAAYEGGVTFEVEPATT